MEIKSKGVCKIPSSLRAKLVQLKGEVSDDQCGESYLQDQDQLRQLPGAIHTFKRGSYVSGGQKTRRKKVLVFTYLPFPKRDERARVLQTSTSYHSQSCLVTRRQMLQGGFLPPECRGDGKLRHLAIRKPCHCERAIPSLLSFNKYWL